MQILAAQYKDSRQFSPLGKGSIVGILDSVEKAILERKCIITGEPTVPGSFLCERFHVDEIVKLYEMLKETGKEILDQHVYDEYEVRKSV